MPSTNCGDSENGNWTESDRRPTVSISRSDDHCVGPGWSEQRILIQQYFRYERLGHPTERSSHQYEFRSRFPLSIRLARSFTSRFASSRFERSILVQQPANEPHQAYE